MSTKIYDAYKIPLDKLNDFLKRYDTHILKKATERLEKIMASITAEFVEAEHKKVFTDGSVLTPKLDRYFRINAALDQCARASKQLKRDPIFDVDAGCWFYIRDGFAYLKLTGEYWIHEGFKSPKWAKDISYWNNTDQPDNVSDLEWEARRCTWESLLDGNKFPKIRFDSLKMSETEHQSKLLHALGGFGNGR